MGRLPESSRTSRAGRGQSERYRCTGCFQVVWDGGR
jgi:hypothetical protein